MDTTARRDRLRARLAGAGVDSLLVTKLVNVAYLTGFTGSTGKLLVDGDGRGDVFVTDGRYAAQAAAEVGDLGSVITRDDGWLVGALGGRSTLGLESGDVSWDDARRIAGLLDGVDVVPARGHVEALRVVKEPPEIDLLAQACTLTGEAWADLLSWIRPGLSERDVARRLERTVVDLGADAPAFPAIVAAGENGARPHHQPTGRALRAGDLVKVDFGARLGGYHSDMTRMVALGDAARDLLEVFAVVRSAQQAGLDAVRAGARGADVDAACRSVVTEAGHGDAFLHGTGHGVGLEVHEDPRIAATAADTLAAGAVVTVEPGVYLPGRGGVRIEDTVVVTERGATVLTTTPKDLAVV